MQVLSAKVIEKAAAPGIWTDTMELALQAVNAEGYFTPDRMHITMDANTLLLMPSVGPEMFATKLVSVFPGNAKKDKPVIQGTVILNESSTGETLALLNGAKLTAMRTAAVASVGVRHLTKPNATTLGVIGAGAQGRHIAWFASEERELKSVCVYDRSEKVIREFIQFLASHCPNLEVIKCDDVHQVVSRSEIIITATTSQKPVIPDQENLLRGKTFIGVGSYKQDMREFPESLFRLVDQVWLDAEKGKTESGDLIFPIEKKLLQPEQLRKISDLLSNPNEFDSNKTHLYKTVGLGIFDLFGAQLVYNNACESNMGEDIAI